MLVLTILLATVLMVIVVAAMAIGLILTGKSRLKRGCGFRPGSQKERSSCSICGDQKKCEENEKNDMRDKAD